MPRAWYEIDALDSVVSPALVFYPDRIRANIRRMLDMVGDVQRLRPHVKTHKSADVIRLHREQGVTKFKAATIAEAEMVAMCGPADILVSYPLVGPNVARLLALMQKYPASRLSTVADDAAAIQALGKAAAEAGLSIGLFLEIDCGFHRTGVLPDERAEALYRSIVATPGLEARGLHAYDGHLRDVDPIEREASVDAAFAPVLALRHRLEAAGLAVPALIASGSPTFSVHARLSDRESSPGTTVLWDAGYGTRYLDLAFEPAALLVTRVISKPGPQRLAFDLGYKAVSADPAPPRAIFLEIPDAAAVIHSEEHLVIETAAADRFQVGQATYAVPWHICPTVALHREAVIVDEHVATGTWAITARDRVITV